MDKKQCFKCKLWKDIGLFYAHPRTTDRHLNKCKKCTKKDVSDRYYNPDFIERIKEYERLRFKDPERKLKTLLYQKKRRLTHRGKYKANTAIRNALRGGRITRKPCEVCGEIKSEAHHTDYRKYYQVRWLCFKHHREAHKFNH